MKTSRRLITALLHTGGGGAEQGQRPGAGGRGQPRANRGNQVLGVKADQPRVSVRTNEGSNNKEHGFNPQCDRLCLLSLFQVRQPTSMQWQINIQTCKHKIKSFN